jgi:NAD(P)-dependent dehydrogenase (short-subunit alcohol dehydrogenase family)
MRPVRPQAEAEAVALAQELGSLKAYPGGKRALAAGIRQHAVKPECAGAGVILNTIVPGAIKTPMIERALANPDQAKTIRAYSPIAVADYAEAEDVAELADFLLNLETTHLIGQAIYLDSGSEAIVRPNY